jgi:hypothetical protein
MRLEASRNAISDLRALARELQMGSVEEAMPRKGNGFVMLSIKSKSALLFSLQALRGGVQKHFANKSVTVAGVVVPATTIVQAVQAQIDAINAIAAAKAAWMHAVQQQRAQLESVIAPYAAAVRHYAAVMFGTTSLEYQDFGFAPTKKPARTAMSKAKAALQNVATRVARHTMGSKQRAKIHGVVDAQQLVAALVPSTPANGGNER